MKKRGFTLAEILVSLGIIGVVAATVLPTLVTSHKTQVYEATRKSAESTLENAFSAMMAAEMAEDLSFTKIWAEDASLETNLKEYMKATTTTSDITDGIGFKLKSGAVISIKKHATSDSEAAEVRIDANGTEKPNKRDVDIFLYYLKFNGALTYMPE